LSKNLKKLFEERTKLIKYETEGNSEAFFKNLPQKSDSLGIHKYISFLYNNFNDEINDSDKKEVNNI